MSCCFHKKNKNKIHPLEDIFEPRPKSILKNKPKRIKRKSIYPKKQENCLLIEERTRKRQEFTEKFCAEIIKCGGCQEHFNLGQNEIKINCASCNNFFHCHIAGACVGSDCSVMVDGNKESLKYCMSCVNPYLRINIMDNGQCLCKTCEGLSDTPEYYKKV